MATEVLSDAPESADRYEFSVEDGDVILLATDGVFDNVPDSVLVKEIGSLQTNPSAVEMQVNQYLFWKLRVLPDWLYICFENWALCSYRLFLVLKL